MDFAGMGDSGAAQRIHADELFAHDILGVIEHAEFERPTLVGHSFGGGRVVQTCADHPGSVARAVIIDTHMRLT